MKSIIQYFDCWTTNLTWIDDQIFICLSTCMLLFNNMFRENSRTVYSEHLLNIIRLCFVISGPVYLLNMLLYNCIYTTRITNHRNQIITNWYIGTKHYCVNNYSTTLYFTKNALKVFSIENYASLIVWFDQNNFVSITPEESN